MIGMSLPERDAYLTFEAGTHNDPQDDDDTWVDIEGPAGIPLGEEGILLDHAGAEDNELYRTIFIQDGIKRCVWALSVTQQA